MLTRRTLLANVLKLSAGLGLFNVCSFAWPEPPLTLRLTGDTPVNLPANFTGLGYEMSSVASPGLLSVHNRRYLELVKGLGPAGVLRIGGIVSDYTRYEPNGPVAAEPKNTVITRADLEQFAEFLGASGWRAIWSLNFAQGSLADAVEEARAVHDMLGDRLLALEIGNEVENYGHGAKPFRKPPYRYEDYLAEYNAWHDAIKKAAPGIRFAAPDTANSVEWVERMAADARDKVQLLTTHYYRNGADRGTAEQLLFPDPRLKDVATRLGEASRRSGIPWRMCETNSFYGGGRPGVSDTFVGTLWVLDYMLRLAGWGCSGVNIETGVNQLGFVSSYSPIQDDGKGRNSAGAPYYGMLAFTVAAAGCDQVLPVDVDAQGVNLAAYALGRDGKPLSVVVVNKDMTQDAQVSLAGLGMGSMSALRLVSPSASSTSGATFGGAVVDAEGKWKSKRREMIRNGVVSVPKMSAVVLRRPEE